MSTVQLFVSMSVDGYVAGPNVSDTHPMGEDGERLHEWMFAEPTARPDLEVIERVRADTGAVVIGRRTFDLGLPHWKDVPYPVPSFVVTHESRPALPQESGTFTFVDGVPKAVELAQAAAGARKVILMGADLSRQALRAGLVDELLISLIPVTLGGGARLFEDVDNLTLEPTGTVNSPAATHLSYRVVR
ncbi:dihydrofolate reductase family protein [Actinophytocola sp.]|jgi:dihydrofolate reductase|uniref:dihydrofolate reductase family protein n=1 Tax=Actinophytocola sp. TaxID=1872138 RepID=UPI002EDA3AAD